MATGAVSRSHASARRDLVGRESLGALILAGSIPFLFFHERYQPELDVGVGSTTVDVRLSDLAVAVVLLAAGVAASRGGLALLGAARWLWVSGAALLVWLAFQTVRPISLDDALFDDHLVSYLKLV